ncbi:MAG: hypothetical protein ACLPKB_19070 [Xanthobacteraceae bacterium]
MSRIDVKIDLLLKHAGVDHDPFRELPRDVADALQRGHTIQAIKPYREASGLRLKVAKDFIEDAQRRAGEVSSMPSKRLAVDGVDASRPALHGGLLLYPAVLPDICDCDNASQGGASSTTWRELASRLAHQYERNDAS